MVERQWDRCTQLSFLWLMDLVVVLQLLGDLGYFGVFLEKLLMPIFFS